MGGGRRGGRKRRGGRGAGPSPPPPSAPVAPSPQLWGDGPPTAVTARWARRDDKQQADSEWERTLGYWSHDSNCSVVQSLLNLHTKVKILASPSPAFRPFATNSGAPDNGPPPPDGPVSNPGSSECSAETGTAGEIQPRPPAGPPPKLEDGRPPPPEQPPPPAGPPPEQATPQPARVAVQDPGAPTVASPPTSPSVFFPPVSPIVIDDQFSVVCSPTRNAATNGRARNGLNPEAPAFISSAVKVGKDVTDLLARVELAPIDLQMNNTGGVRAVLSDMRKMNGILQARRGELKDSYTRMLEAMLVESMRKLTRAALQADEDGGEIAS